MKSTKKVALVTGGGQGIGAAICKRLSDDGFAVAVADLNIDTANKVAEEINKNGGDAISLHVDVSDRESMVAAVEAATEKFGDFNVIVNNAGIGPTSPIGEITQEQFNTVFQVNVGSTLWGIQAASNKFKELKHGGRIISATSQAGVVGNPGLVLYCGSKFAIRGMTQTYTPAHIVAPQAIVRHNFTRL